MIEAYPLHWPAHKRRTPDNERKRALFSNTVKEKSSYSDNYYSRKKELTIAEALHRVLDELSKYTRVGQTHRVPRSSIIVSSNIPVRQDGLPYSNTSKPKDPGVAVYFKLDDKDYCLPCDKWNRVADNIAAIAAHIAAMRGIERWGVGELHDVYTGFKALPEKTSGEVVAWWTILGISHDSKPSQVTEAYRKLANKYHPDKPSGDAEKFIQVKFAYEQAMKLFKGK